MTVPQHDPRLLRDAEPPAECSGFALQCNDRPAARCAAGCEETIARRHPSRQRCLSYVDPEACESDADWPWIADWCEEVSIGCRYNSSQTACRQDDCIWAADCTGTAASCSAARTAEDCATNLGCEWS